MINSIPLVSVLMPVYNGERYLREAIDSVLNQTFSDFEFIIVNDGSVDHTKKIIGSYGDPRILSVENRKNLGIVTSLNRGLKFAKGKYIARMDCDDICVPNRFHKQVSFLERNPDIGGCGTWVEVIGGRHGEIWRYPTTPDGIQCQLLFKSALAHPSVMLNKSILRGENHYYRNSFDCAEDYDLWVRLVEHHKLANIGEALLMYRYHEGQIGRKFKERQERGANKIRKYQLAKLGIQVLPNEIEIHSKIANQEYRTLSSCQVSSGSWLLRISEANKRFHQFDQSLLDIYLAREWWSICKKATHLGFAAWSAFQENPLSQKINLTQVEKYKYWVKCLMRYK